MALIPDPEDSRTPPQTEDSAERGWVEPANDSPDPETYDDLGESDELGDVSGDIADEGAGHRG
jgi:hypothetical protein